MPKITALPADAAPTSDDYTVTVDSTSGQTKKVLLSDLPAPGTVTAAKLSTPYGCQLTRSSNKAISNATFTVVDWDGELFDTGGLHSNSVNNSRITIPTGFAGYWLVVFHAKYTGGGSGNRIVNVYKNGGQYRMTRGPLTASDVDVVATELMQLADGDYVEAAAYLDGGAATLQCSATPVQDWSSFMAIYMGKT